MKRPVKRMILTCPGKPRRSVVLMNPPWPEVGMTTSIDGNVYEVAEIRDETVITSVTFPAKKSAACEANEGMAGGAPDPQHVLHKES